MKCLLLLVLAATAFVALAQDDSDGPIIRLEITSEPTISAQGSFSFHPFNLFSQMPSLMSFHRQGPVFPRFLNRLMGEEPEMQMEEDAAPRFDFFKVFEMDPHFGDEEMNPQPVMARIFQRMSGILNAMRFSSMNSMTMNSDDKPLRRGGCTLMQACAEDVESLCAGAKRSALAQAVPRCLKQHYDSLSEKCSGYIDRVYNGGETEESESSSEDATASEESSETTTESTSESAESATPVIVSEESAGTAPAPVVPIAESSESSNGPTPCRAAAAVLCPDVESSDRVGVMACLKSKQSELPDECLAIVKDTAAFNCAPDAVRFCHGIKGRRAIGHCLRKRFDELSAECVQSARGLLAERHNLKLDSVKFREERPSFHHAQRHQARLIIGCTLAGLVALVVVAVVIRRRRNRAARASQVATVQLANPSAPQIVLA